MNVFRLLLVPVLFFFAASSLSAISYTWNGTVGNWTDAARWTPNGVPGVGDDATIGGGTVSLTAHTSITHLTLTGGTLNGDFNLTIGGTLTWSNATFGGAGTSAVAGLATFNSGCILSARTLRLDGGGTVATNTPVYTIGGSNLVIPAGQTLTLDCTNNVAWGGGGAHGTITNQGAIVKNGTGYIAFDYQRFVNTGTIQVNAGQFYLGLNNLGGTHTGATFSLASGTFLGPNGGVHTLTGCTFSGTGDFGSAGNATVSTFSGNTFAATLGFGVYQNSAFTLGQNLTVTRYAQDGGALNGTGDLTIGGNMNLTGGTIANAGNWSVGGTLTWSNATFGGTGTATVTGAATLNINCTLSARTLILGGGGAVATNTPVYMNTSANLVIPAGQTLTLNCINNVPWGGGNGGGTITNQGTIVKNGSGFVSFDYQRFVNTGTIQVNAGQFYLGLNNLNSEHTGATFDLAAGTLLTPTGGTHTFTGCTFTGAGDFGSNGSAKVSTFSGNTFTGTVGLAVYQNSTFTLGQNLTAGRYTQDGGTFNGTGNVTVTGNAFISNGTLTHTGNLSVGGTMTWNGGQLGTAPGTITVGGLLTIATSANHLLRAKTLVMNGGANWTGGIIFMSEGAILRNAAGQTFTENIASGVIYNGFGYPGVGTFENFGTFVRNGTGALTLRVNFIDNGGTVQLNSGDMNVGTSGACTYSNTTLHLAANTNFFAEGGPHTFNNCTLTGSGNIGSGQNGGNIGTFTNNTVAATVGLHLVEGVFTLGQDITVSRYIHSAGTFNGTGNVTVTGDAVFNFGAITHTGNLSVGGTFSWNGGQLGTAPGTITVGGLLTIATNGTHLLRAKTLVMNGGGNWAVGNIFISEGAILRNAAGQTFTENTSSGALYNGFGFPGTRAFENLGTFVRNGTGTLFLDLLVTNAGTLKGINAVQFQSTFTNTGTVAPGTSPGILNLSQFDNTAATLQIEIAGPGGPGAANGHDRLDVSGLPAALGGTLDIRLLDGYTPAFGTSFTILNLPTGYTNTAFANVVTTPALSPTAGWTIDYLANAVVLTYCERWYADTDNDGYGNPADGKTACIQPPGYVANNLDCNDANAAIHPGVAETCNGLDDDCDGLADNGVSHPDYAALMALYNSTNGAAWTNNAGWAAGAAGTNCAVCDWTGVVCNGADRVESINLENNNLSGPLPAALGSVNTLKILNLRQNQLSGKIPAALGNLTGLTHLLLSDNQLSGCFAPALDNLCSVANLDFSNNPGLPGGGDFAAFCTDGTGTDAVKAAVKVYLQGPYVAAAQLMHDSLRLKGLLPLTEPYTGLANFTHTGGGGGETTTPAVLAVTGLDAVVDWVFLELHSAADPNLVLATRAALVQRDGDVVDTDGISPVAFNMPTDSAYFIAARHRNHFGVQLGQAQAYPDCFSAVPADFRNLPPQGFYAFNGLNPAQRTVSAGVFALWAGNGRIDYQLKYNGSNNDRNAILTVVGLSTPNAAVPGYKVEDYNLDGVVKYNGSANDRNVLLGNVGIATPSAVLHDQVAR